MSPLAYIQLEMEWFKFANVYFWPAASSTAAAYIPARAGEQRVTREVSRLAKLTPSAAFNPVAK